MVYTIKNEFLTVSVNSMGAEISSIKSNDGCEYLWQGNPEFWSGQAPIMFPICGRFFEGKYTYLGKEYKMGTHGFARNSEFTLVSQGGVGLTLSLSSNEETLKDYPFNFRFDVTYKLIGKTLRTEFKVTNLDSKEMIFALGGHPAFNVPLEDGLSFDDYVIEFENKADAIKLALSDTCFCTYDDQPYMAGGVKEIPLSHSLFDNDAIFLYNTPKKVKLYSKKGSRSVSLSFDRMKYLGLWHTPKKPAPYVCIEPWNSIPSEDGVIDNLLTKKEMIHLESGYTHKTYFDITAE